MNRDELIELISQAFQDVALDGGISLKQATVIDNHHEGVSEAEYLALPLSEITDDWKKIPEEVLDQDPYVPHLDAKGYRYYIPRFMISVLRHYVNSSIRVIGTLNSLYPRKASWQHATGQYSLLTDRQKSAIAIYLHSLPRLVNLDVEDRTVVQRAISHYWGQYLDGE